MIDRQVIITPLKIIKAGQVKHFQIKLPQTAKKIVGVELGGHFISELITTPTASEFTRFKANTLIGDLKLQSCERANIFYAGQLQVDNNLDFADFTKSAFIKIKPFTHQSKQFEDTISVDANSTIIQGIYKDAIGKQTGTDLSYLLKIYLWYKQ